MITSNVDVDVKLGNDLDSRFTTNATFIDRVSGNSMEAVNTFNRDLLK